MTTSSHSDTAGPIRLALASRPWLHRTFYVSDLKPARRGDWGYTTDARRAIVLSPYWQRRLAADCRAVGDLARFLPI